MSFKNYYSQLNSQTGIKAYIKKKIFNNLLKELVKQENEIEKQKETIKVQVAALRKQERMIDAITRCEGFETCRPVKIVQFTPGLWYGDAVSNVMIALHEYLIGKGYDAEIYAGEIDSKLKNDRYKSCHTLPELLPDDIFICHISIESGLMERILRKIQCRRIMFYHNITPARYFEEYIPGLAKLCEGGREQLRRLKDKFECCLTVSEYNRQDLRKEGYTCPVGVLPILIPFEKYKQQPDETVLEQYRDNGVTNILFTGRVAPQKKQEDVIAAFGYYHSHINPRSRLFIVGSADEGNRYYLWLRDMVKEKGLEEAVLFTGHVPFSQLLAYYRLADVFLCMSEHEGFGVPLIEAMLFSVPVVACREAAVPETVGDAGIIVDSKEPAAVAKAIDRAVNDTSLRKTLRYLMQRRLEDFSYENTAGKFDRYLAAILERRNLAEEFPDIKQEAAEELLLRDSPGLLVDVTEITKHEWGTGIHRVVKNIFHQIYNRSENVIPVQYRSGKFITSYSYPGRMEGDEAKPEKTPEFKKGDSILLLDNPWGEFAGFSHILDLAANTGGKSFAVVHDLIPEQYPEVCDSAKMIREHTGWHNMLLQKADAVICVSRTTADSVAGYYEQMKYRRSKPLSLYYFHLGADVPAGEQIPRKEIQDFVNKGKTFLMVGTLEPRKGHMAVLQALQKLPDEIRRELHLLIIGANGWKSDEIRKTLELPEFRENVLWPRDVSDGELRWAYAHADALIAASLQEGFGLPLVEAAHFGIPLICSDIPVFREVTQGNADFFKAMDADALAECLTRWLQTDRHPDPRKIPAYPWQESAREVLDILAGKTEAYKVLQ
jgi:glycosyltransferase involved in cell wall biosynthesis